MAVPPILRPGRAEDAATLAALMRLSRAVAMPWLAVVHTPAEDLAWMAGTVLAGAASRGGGVTVAEVDGVIAGFAGHSRGWLDHLYIHPDRQGRGIGRTLLDHAKATMPGGFDLMVFQRNRRARRFYEAAGCALVRLTDGAANEEREPDALYRWVPA